jgi:hypothetical protein
MSRYWAGTLTPDERRMLIEAALDDQDLFDELAAIEEFKEALADPGAKQRVIAALDTNARAAWWRPAAWAAVPVAIAVAITAWIVFKPRKIVEVAQVQAPAPAVVAPAPAVAPDEKKPETSPAPRKKIDRAAPAPAQPKPENAPAVAEQESKASVAIAPQRAAPMAFAPPLTPPRFALEWHVENQTLILKFTADGYISIHFAPGSDTIVRSRVTAGSTRREPIPNNATEAAIVYTAGQQTTSGGVELIKSADSGTVEDPSRTRIDLLVRFYD